MTKKQSNEFRMFMTTQLFLDGTTSVWSVIPKNILYKHDVDEIIGLIGEKSEEAKNIISVAGRKNKLEDLIELKVSSLSGPFQAYADDTDSLDLAKVIKASKSSLKQMKEEDLVVFSNMIVSKATEKLTELTDYGVTPESLTEIKAIVDEFAPLIGKPRNIQNTKFVALGSIEELFTAGKQILKNKMDRVMLNFRESNPEFHNGYERARTIVDL